MAGRFFDSDCALFQSMEQGLVPADGKECPQKPILSNGSSLAKKYTMRVLTQTVNDFVVDQLSKVPEVNVVHTDQAGDVFYVWVLLKDDDDGALDRVLDVEQGIMREFTDITFDFSVLFQMGRSFEELIGPVSPVFRRS